MTYEKPRHRDGYKPEDLQQVEAACLSFAVTLGAAMDDLCIVGGLVPSLLIDRRQGPEPGRDAGHPGTNDLDIGMAVALLADQGYALISSRLRQEGFGPGTNDNGNPTPQTWKLADKRVTIDFLLPPIPDGPGPSKVQALEGDFGALIIPGIELAPYERELVEIDGMTLKGERARRTIPVCGPATFVVLKALAFADRAEPKDAYDLVYVVRRWHAGVDDIVERLAGHTQRHEAIVHRALTALANDFSDPGHLGPMRAAEFDTLVDGSPNAAAALDAAAADAHGYVDDLLRRCQRAGLLGSDWGGGT